MAEYKTKPEISPQKRAIKLPPAIGDWTTYKAAKVLTKKIKTGLYGFDRLSEEELDQALTIHYRFGEKLASALKIDLRVGAEFYSIQAEQTTYLNFLRTISGPVVQGKLKLAELHEGVVLVLDLPFANTLINQALGSRDLEPISRGLTEAENTILQTALLEYLSLYTSAFENVFENPELTLTSSPDLLPDPELTPTSTFINFQLEISLAENLPGRIILGYLGNSLKILLQKHLAEIGSRPLDFSKLPSSILNRLRIPLTATIGKTNLFTSQLKDLEQGDVVSLETSIHSALPVSIGKYLTVLAQPAIKNKKCAVRIASFEVEETVKIAPPVEVKEEKAVEQALPKEKEAVPEEKIEEETPEEEILEEEFPEEEEFLEEEFPEEEELEGKELEEEFPEKEEFPEEEK